MDTTRDMLQMQARSQGGANGCNCTPPSPPPPPPHWMQGPLWQAMNIVHLIVYCSAMYMYTYQLDLPCSCLHVYCARVHVRALVLSKCRIGKMATRHHACIIFGVNSSLSSIPKARTPAFPPIFNLFRE